MLCCLSLVPFAEQRFELIDAMAIPVPPMNAPSMCRPEEKKYDLDFKSEGGGAPEMKKSAEDQRGRWNVGVSPSNVLISELQSVLTS